MRLRSVGLLAPADLRQAAALEDHVDGLWVGGHVASPTGAQEVVVALARLSAVTSRVVLGSSVLLLPLYPPALVAKQVAELDRATAGRLVLGVGVGGEYPVEFSACQVPVAERGSRADEAIPLLRRLWTGEPVSSAGPHYPMQDVRVLPVPHQRGGPPVVVAGRKGAALRRAALLGDGWIPYLLGPERWAAGAAEIRLAAEAAGRDLAGFGWYAFAFVHVGPDGDLARVQAARGLGRTWRREVGLPGGVAAGTAGEVVAQLRELVSAGAEHLVLAPVPGSTEGDPYGRLVADVLPALRDGLTATA